MRAFVEVRDIGPSFTTYDPVLGKRIRANLQCERIAPEFRMTFRSNSLGWRGPEPDVPPTGVVLFVGDSFTMGFGVDDGEEFPQLVGKALGRPVVNMGIGGNGNARWLRLLRDEAPKFSPRQVVLQLCSNDLGDNVIERLATLGDDGAIVEHPVPPPGLARTIQVVIDSVPGLAYSHLIGLLREFRPTPAAPPETHAPVAPNPVTNAPAADAPAPGLALTLALVESAVRICRERGWEPYVLSADLDPEQTRPFAELCARLEVPFVRMPSKQETPERYFVVDGHWNAAGHRAAADQLTAVLGR